MDTRMRQYGQAVAEFVEADVANVGLSYCCLLVTSADKLPLP